ncbi:hypothetical protein JOE68_001198 [Saccharothrix algeriensis]|uniref:Uncharacterized protein n=1 Tax=Saccharothrix algeriensis TaxID=173560 RepID=A0ABS2S263_9PSEU|nr:hypothetical protein [Saccharothrix algeriensis]
MLELCAAAPDGRGTLYRAFRVAARVREAA